MDVCRDVPTVQDANGKSLNLEPNGHQDVNSCMLLKMDGAAAPEGGPRRRGWHARVSNRPNPSNNAFGAVGPAKGSILEFCWIQILMPAYYWKLHGD